MNKIDYLIEADRNVTGKGMSNGAQLATLGAATGGVLGAGYLYDHFTKKPVASKLPESSKSDKSEVVKSSKNSEPESIKTPESPAPAPTPDPDLNPLTTTKPQAGEGPVKIPQAVLDRAAHHDKLSGPPAPDLNSLTTTKPTANGPVKIPQAVLDRAAHHDKLSGPPAPDLNSLTTTKPTEEGPVKIPEAVLDRAAEGRVLPPSQELKMMNTDYLSGNPTRPGVDLNQAFNSPGIDLKINDLLNQTPDGIQLDQNLIDQLGL